MSEKTENDEARSAVGFSDALLERTDLAGLPDGIAPLTTVHDKFASALLSLAERQVAETRKVLGPKGSKPRLAEVEETFNTRAGKAPRAEEDVARLMRSPAFVMHVASYDRMIDRTIAAGLNDFDKTSVQSGSAVQTGFDDWEMASRIYKSTLRSAGSILEARIQDAVHSPTFGEYDIMDYDRPAKGKKQLEFYRKSSKIADALLDYEQVMHEAGVELAKAYGELVGILYNSVNGLAVAEATQIAVTHGAHKTFWASVYALMNESRQQT